MKKNYPLHVCILLLTTSISFLNAQNAFHKGSLLISVSEGHTVANYKTIGVTKTSDGPKNVPVTNDAVKPTPIENENLIGIRDPFFIEYGITNRIGIGFTAGNDIFTIDPSKFYGFTTSTNKVKAESSEFTFDSNYHFFVNQRLDVSVCGSLGLFSVECKGKDGDADPYKYEANGGIVRVGVKARYYFYKRLGAFGMISSFSGKCSDKDIKDNTVGEGYTTSIKGQTIEIGLCYRFF